MDKDIWQRIRENSKEGNKKRILASLEDIIDQEVNVQSREKIDSIVSEKEDYIEKEVKRRLELEMKSDGWIKKPEGLMFVLEGQELEDYEKHSESTKGNYHGAAGGAYSFKFTPTGLGEIVEIFYRGEEVVKTSFDNW